MLGCSQVHKVYSKGKFVQGPDQQGTADHMQVPDRQGPLPSGACNSYLKVQPS